MVDKWEGYKPKKKEKEVAPEERQRRLDALHLKIFEKKGGEEYKVL